MKIKKIAVIGSGVMGAGIAAHIANSGTEVLLYDVFSNSDNRNKIVIDSIEKMKSSNSSFTHLNNLSFITPCNLEDDIKRLIEVDWIIEAIIEKIEIKTELYKKIEQYSNPKAIISSNTSTILLSQLSESFDYDFKSRFLITHFFNPPRHMRLLELVKGDVSKENLYVISKFVDFKLGKEIVICNDTPGFIANRIGCYFMIIGLLEAIEQKICIDEADYIMSKFGIPKTGIFGLFDLIGVDVMKLIAESLMINLPKSDDFCINYKKTSILNNMVAKNLLGKKSNSGFYRFNLDSKKKDTLDLNDPDFNYIESRKLDFHENDIKKILKSDNPLAKFAKDVMLKTLNYATKLIPTVTEDIVSIDNSMKLGLNWKYGIFELIDLIDDNNFITNNTENPSPILKQITNQKFYKNIDNQLYKFDNNKYSLVVRSSEKLCKEDITFKKQPLYFNDSMNLWEIEDEILFFEISSKAGSLDWNIFTGLNYVIDNIIGNYRGMIISNFNNIFSGGANIKYLSDLVKSLDYIKIQDFIQLGQSSMLMLKNSKKPVITASKNFALGGGCELIMHSSNNQSHIELYTGLVEANIGLVPAWGGCKEFILRAKTEEDVLMAFKNILSAKISSSAQEAINMKILTEEHITMNIDRLYIDAKNQLLNSSKSIADRKILKFDLKHELKEILDNEYNLSDHDKLIGESLIEIFCCYEEKEIMKKEAEMFMELIKMSKTHDRIENMLVKGKPFKN